MTYEESLPGEKEGSQGKVNTLSCPFGQRIAAREIAKPKTIIVFQSGWLIT